MVDFASAFAAEIEDWTAEEWVYGGLITVSYNYAWARDDTRTLRCFGLTARR